MISVIVKIEPYIGVFFFFFLSKNSSFWWENWTHVEKLRIMLFTLIPLQIPIFEMLPIMTLGMLPLLGP